MYINHNPYDIYNWSIEKILRTEERIKKMEVWKPKERRVYMDWIKKIIQQNADINDWERNFVTGVYTILQFKEIEGKGNVSEAQAKKLESIYAEKTK